MFLEYRFKQKSPPPWQAITASVGVLVITLLLGHIFRAAINQIAKVEHDYREMMELKHRAEAADVAKSQVCIRLLRHLPFQHLFTHLPCVFLFHFILYIFYRALPSFLHLCNIPLIL